LLLRPSIARQAIEEHSGRNRLLSWAEHGIVAWISIGTGLLAAVSVAVLDEQYHAFALGLGAVCVLSALACAARPMRNAYTASVCASTALQSLIVILLGLFLAAFSLFVVRPNADDVFYVNSFLWVA
jgi:hypothetical protein